MDSDEELQSIAAHFSMTEQQMGTEAYSATVQANRAIAMMGEATAARTRSMTRLIDLFAFLVIVFGLAFGFTLLVFVWKMWVF